MTRDRTPNPAPTFLAVAIVALAAAACGGDGGPASPSPAAPAAPAPGDAARPAPGAAPAAAPAGTAAVAGVVRYAGEVPKLRPISMSGDPGCAAKHGGPLPSEALVVGEGGALANVFVEVTAGLPERAWPPPASPVVIDQHGCRYVPHVAGVMAGQPLRILNSDGLLHNVHALPKANKPFNQAMPASLTETEHVFAKPEPAFTVKCDVHPWMGAWITVTDHPYFAVSGSDGAFRISGLPAGRYTLEARHDRLRTASATVAVADGETATVELSLSP